MSAIIRLVRALPVHVTVIGLCVIWMVPTLGLLVTSFRPARDTNETGWWTVLSERPGASEYRQACQACHGADGNAVPGVNVKSAELAAKYRRSIQFMQVLNQTIEGQPHLGEGVVLDQNQAADLLAYLRRESGLDDRPRLTLSNYIDAIVGYRGANTYLKDCEAGTASAYLSCTWSDVTNPRGMGRAFINSWLYALPATLIPIAFAALAAYAFSWLHFRGRLWLFVLLVTLQIVPLQIALVPISRLYADVGLSNTFPGAWLFATGFGLPYAIYLIRNFIGSIPRELVEAAYIDGTNHWTAFRFVVLPLTTPALASLSIFQFLWVWNDLLGALVFLGGRNPVLTYQINGLVQTVGVGWHLLTAAAFLSMIVPLAVFFGLQRYFVRGLIAGAVKG
jgi:alpha-glucoside transport system permease protein